MVRKKKSKPLGLFGFLKKKEETLYHVCLHPVACWFDKVILLWQPRFWFSLLLAFILSLVSAITPICTQETCYTVFAQLFLEPTLFLKPIAPTLIFSPFLITFSFFALFWFALLSVFAWVEKKQLIHELVLPVITGILFVYIFMITSGLLGPFFLHTSLIECTSNNDCIRAGYVGEVCASVYKPVYTTYSSDLRPLTDCVCSAGNCVGS